MAAGLTQDQFARLIDYSKSTVTKVEQGLVPASPQYIARSARVLDVSPDELQGTPYFDTLNQEGPLRGVVDLQAILTEGLHVRATCR